MAGRISNFGGGLRPLSARDVLLTPTQKAAFPGSWGKFLLEEVQIADDTDAIPTCPVYGNDCFDAQLVLVRDVE